MGTGDASRRMLSPLPGARKPHASESLVGIPCTGSAVQGDTFCDCDAHGEGSPASFGAVQRDPDSRLIRINIMLPML